MRKRRSIAILVALCVNGVAACSAAAPTPSLTAASIGVSATPAPTPSTTPSREPSFTPSPAPRDGLAGEIEIHAIDPGDTHPVLEFASDGHAVLFSSGKAEDAGPEGAPDLWRYEPGSPKPELAWRNPERNHSIVKIGGDLGMVAFVETPLTGERAWNLWLIPDEGEAPILLDSHPGVEDVSSLVPSFSLYQPMIAWTAFDRGPSGPVSQLLVAESPDWTPRVLLERPADEAELWLPSLHGFSLAYTEVRYSEDRTTDERSVHLLSVGDPASARRLDTSGRATMPLILGDSVFWKETDPGFNMFNWGRMLEYDRITGTVTPVSVWPQEFVNYPSVGTRFLAWWGADAFTFGVYDTELDRARRIESYSTESDANVMRPYVSGDLLVWMYSDRSTSELRYTFLPGAGTDRGTR